MATGPLDADSSAAYRQSALFQLMEHHRRPSSYPPPPPAPDEPPHAEAHRLERRGPRQLVGPQREEAVGEQLRARGDEFLGHGHTNSDEQGGLPEAEERALMQDCMNRIKAEEGEAPIGWMSPWLSNSAITADLLEEIGYKYFMDWTTDDQPIWFKTRSGGKILSMPYPVECNDNRALVWFRYTSQEFADMLIDQFDEMLRQAERGTPVVCPISLHPFSVGRPYRMPALRRVYEHILKHQDRIWLTKPIDIYNHIESLSAGIVPGS